MRFVATVTPSRARRPGAAEPQPSAVQALTRGERGVRKRRDGPARSILAPGLRIRHGCGHRSAGGVQRRCPGGRHHSARAGPSRASDGVAARSRTNWPLSGRRSPPTCSFFVIGISWVNHHAMLHNVARLPDGDVRQPAVVDVHDGHPVLDRDRGGIPSPRRPRCPSGSSDRWAAGAGVVLSFTALVPGRPAAGCFTPACQVAGRQVPFTVSPPGRSRLRRRSVWRF